MATDPRSSQALHPLGSLGEIFPEGVIGIGQDQGVLPGTPPPQNLEPLQPTQEERQTHSPTPKQSAAELLSGASQGGQKDSLGQMLLQAGINNAGPLAGLFTALGAELAGKDPDFAAAAAMEGFRQLQKDNQAKQQLEDQRRQRILENKIATIGLGMRMGSSKSMLKEQMQGVVADVFGPGQISEPELDMAIKHPDVWDLAFSRGKVDPELAQRAIATIDSEGLPLDSPIVSMAWEKGNQFFVPPADDTPPSELFPREDAVAAIEGQFLDAGFGDLSRAMAEARVPHTDTGQITQTFLSHAQQQAPRTAGVVGSGLGSVMATAAGLPEEYGGILGRLQPNHATAIVDSLRRMKDTSPEQFVGNMMRKVESGEPLDSGEYLTLQLMSADRALKSIKGAVGLAEEIWALGGGTEGSDEEKATVAGLQRGRSFILSAMSRIPELLGASDALTQGTFTEEQIISGEGLDGMWDNLEVFNVVE